MDTLTTDRRRFLAYFSGVGMTSTLLPGTLWARIQEQQADEVTERRPPGPRSSSRRRW